MRLLILGCLLPFLFGCDLLIDDTSGSDPHHPPPDTTPEADAGDGQQGEDTDIQPDPERVVIQDLFTSLDVDGWLFVRGTSSNLGKGHPPDNSAVRVENGVLTLTQDVTDNGPFMHSKAFPVIPGEIITVRRRAKISPANDKLLARMALFGSEQPGLHSDFDDLLINIHYMNYHWDGSSHQGDWNGFIFNQRLWENGVPREVEPILDPVWDDWFEEEVVYDTGLQTASYRLNGQDLVTHEPMGVLITDQVKLVISPYGWYTGHTTSIDSIEVIVTPGTATPPPPPPPPPPPTTDPVAPKLATGISFTLALKQDGTVWAWGNNGNGQLGDDSRTDNSTPRQVEGLPPVRDIAAGSQTSYAVAADGTLWVWGNSSNLRDTDLGNRSIMTPERVPGLAGVLAIDCGKTHVLALMENGTLRAWGSGTYGKLGDGHTENRYAPVQVQGITNATAISGGGEYSLALLDNRTVWSWGTNSGGVLGIGLDQSNTPHSSVPVQVVDLTDVTAIAAGNSNFALALKSDGTVWGWGANANANSYGLGTEEAPNTGVGTHLRPILTGFEAIESLAIYDSNPIAIKHDGTVWCAGFYSTSIGILPALIPNDHEHILPIVHTNSRRLPFVTQSPHLENIQSMAAPWGQGPSHIAFITNDGNIWAGGKNSQGQLGNGTSHSDYVRVPVQTLLNVLD